MSLTLKQISLGFIALAIAVGGYFTASIPAANALTSLENVQAGDLVKGATNPAVYYMGADGFRYVFPNSATYFTWYSDFSTVKTIADTDLPKIQIGGNVTYKPGVRMIKIQSDPKTYAVEEGGVLRHVATEAAAVALYGSSWNQQIDDVSDGFFGNYTITDNPINDSSDYNTSDVLAGTTDINDDKDLMAPADISITDSAYMPIDATIEPGQGVRFTNNGSVNHNATSDNLTWGTGTLRPGQSKIVRFEEAGVYTFFDGLNSSSTGAIYVQ